LNENLESFAAMTLRTLLICYKEGGDNAVNENEAISDLVILGMVGIKDPLREEIP
jgi:magnesium-transporting ATPase (P-type)